MPPPRKRAAAKKVPESLREVVASGDRPASLRALRDKLAAEVEQADGRTLPALAKQLADVLREIEALPLAKEVDPVDDLTSKRAARQAAASGM